MKTVMELLRDEREDHDLTQSQVAEILDISQQHYSKYETGEYDLPLRHFITLAQFYGVSADYLIGRNDQMDNSKLKMIYLTKSYTCSDLVNDILLLDSKGKAAVVDYVALQKLRMEKNKK